MTVPGRSWDTHLKTRGWRACGARTPPLCASSCPTHSGTGTSSVVLVCCFSVSIGFLKIRSTMVSRLEVSPPSGIFISQTDLPNSGVLYAATNETGTAQTLRVSWATSVNVRAQLHGDSTILDGMTALWTLEPFSMNNQFLTLRKLRGDWITGAEIKADLISEEMALREADGFYSMSTPRWTEWEVEMDITARATGGRPSITDASTLVTDADLLPLLNLAGSTRLGDGSIQLPDGRIVDTTGAIKESDGTIRFPDGSILLPSGDLIFTDGYSVNIHSSSSYSRKSSYDLGQGEFQLDIDMHYPPGTMKKEDGYHLPNGMIVTDEYVKMPDGCIKWHHEERYVSPVNPPPPSTSPQPPKARQGRTEAQCAACVPWRFGASLTASLIAAPSCAMPCPLSCWWILIILRSMLPFVSTFLSISPCVEGPRTVE